jgi:hypothetical protein
MTVLRWFPVSLFAATTVVLAACTGTPEGNIDTHELGWDSAGGNPTHATHSIMAEFSIEQLASSFPEVATYKSSLLQGANLELHDVNAGGYESLRVAIGGNNWAAAHPELLWERAQGLYKYGDRARAYFYVGVILHYVQDMGVPAHAFQVHHQSDPWHWDHLEVLAFTKYDGDKTAAGPMNPQFANPLSYIEWSAEAARQHFRSSFPGATYTREFLPKFRSDLNATQRAFLRGRETHCAYATTFALQSAAQAFAR